MTRSPPSPASRRPASRPIPARLPLRLTGLRYRQSAPDGTSSMTIRDRVAVLIPCFNEEVAIATVMADFHRVLPDARVHVYDNNSTDRTRTVAIAAGAGVRSERRQGKRHVVRRMFADVEADIYLLVGPCARHRDARTTRSKTAGLSRPACKLDPHLPVREPDKDSAPRIVLATSPATPACAFPQTP